MRSVPPERTKGKAGSGHRGAAHRQCWSIGSRTGRRKIVKAE
jgi:hypothetical protein